MKKFFSILAAITAIGMATPAAKAAVEVSVDFFHDNLEAYGDWVEVGNYGYCWQPHDVDRDWRPYSEGRWVYTDAGWTFDSDEPFGWAVYHYGRWARVEQVGWVWVPGTEWGPAWVSWRSSSSHIGWAPLPPEADFRVSVGLNARVDADFDIGPTYYNFVEMRNFGAPRLRQVIVQPSENITIIQQTTNITKITTVNNVVYNGGPQYDVVSRQSAQPIPRLKLERRTEGDPTQMGADQLKTRVTGGSLQVAALQFNNNPATAPKKVREKVESAKVDRGWTNAGPTSEVEKVRSHLKSNSASAPSAPESSTGKAAPTLGAPEVSGGQQHKGENPTMNATPPALNQEPVAPAKSEKPGKLNKGEKKANRELQGEKAAPDASEQTIPEAPQKTEKMKEDKTQRLPDSTNMPEQQTKKAEKKQKRENMESKTEHLPDSANMPEQQTKKAEKKQKRENIDQPMGNTPPPEAEMPKEMKHEKGEKQPKPDKAERSEARQQAGPALRPQEPQREREPQNERAKGNGKGREEKKDAPRTEAPPQ